MDVFDAIRSRRSIRKYKDKPIAWDLMVQILQAGKYAPCAGNYMNWKFIVVKTDPKRKVIAKACNQEWMEQAPVFVVVVAEPMKAERFYGTRGSRLYTVQGCAASIQNMMLMATNIGLGSCWVGAFNEDDIWRILGLPEETSVQGVVTFGYADEQPEMPPKHRIEHVMFFEKWWGRLEQPKTHLGYWSLWNMKMVDAGKKALGKLKDKAEKKIEEKRKKK